MWIRKVMQKEKIEKEDIRLLLRWIRVHTKKIDGHFWGDEDSLTVLEVVMETVKKFFYS